VLSGFAQDGGDHLGDVAAAAIVCLQVANEEWVRLGGQADMLELYDTAVRAIRT
jgi:hypothetical protein